MTLISCGGAPTGPEAEDETDSSDTRIDDTDGCVTPACMPEPGFDENPVLWRVPDGGQYLAGFDALGGTPGANETGEAALGYPFWTSADLDGDGRIDLIVTAEAVPRDSFPLFGRVFGYEDGSPHWLVYPGSNNGFSPEPIEWSVPEGGEYLSGFDDVEGNYGIGAEDFGYDNWSTLDLNGDGRLDIVVTSKSVPDHQGFSDAPLVVGGLDTPRWDVYLGREGGFSPTAIAWHVPQGGRHRMGFYELDGVSGTGSGPVGYNRWATLDIDADGLPDLVVTSVRVTDDADYRWDQAFGYPDDPHWRVYRGTTDGFATEATPWSVPDGGLHLAGFNALSGSPDNEATSLGAPRWTTTDLDGDGYPDLVLTAEGIPHPMYGVSERVFGYPNDPHWRVYRGTSDGFESEWVRWNVPAGGRTNVGFDRFVGTAGIDLDGSTHPSYATFDIDGDRLLDLVFSAEPVPDGESEWSPRVFGYGDQPHWRVHRGGADGFTSDPIEWPVPVGGETLLGFNGFTGSAGDGDDQSWTTSDVNGDGRRDLIITAQAIEHPHGWAAQVFGYGAGATPHWRVHLGGF